MNRNDARRIAVAIADQLGDDRRRLKAVHVVPRLHAGMLTVRCYFVNSTAPDPDPHIFNSEELDG